MPTHKLISSVTVGAGGAANIQFTSIPATYTDLLVKYSLRGSQSAFRMNINITYNAISSSYSNIYLNGANGSAGSASNATGTSQIYAGEIPAATATANTFASGEIYVPNYASSKFKSVSIENAQESNTSSDVFTSLIAGLVSNTETISSLIITPGAGNFVQYSTAYL